MKILAKIKKRSLILGILFAMLIIGIVYAAEYYQVNSGAQATINEWSVCKKVTNNNALAIFVPTKTAAEWTAFRTYATGVSYAECCSANGVACSSDSNCCSAICGTDADADNYFSAAAGHTGTCQATSLPYTDCNDSCATCYPGSTASTASPDGLDQDCDGTIDEDVTSGWCKTGSTYTRNCNTTCGYYGMTCDWTSNVVNTCGGTHVSCSTNVCTDCLYWCMCRSHEYH